MRPFAIMRMRKPVASGPTAPVIRSSASQFVNSTNPVNHNFSAGAAANDSYYIFTENGWGTNTPSGWSLLKGIGGTNTGGAILYKKLTSADITTGYVTITFGGSFAGIIIGVCFIGECTPTSSANTQNAAGSTTRTQASESGQPIVAGNVALHYGSGRANMTVTANRGSLLQTTSNASASGAVYAETLTASGGYSVTFTFSTAPTGDYYATVSVQSGKGPGPSDLWRVYVTGTTSGASDLVSIGECELRQSVGGANVALGRTYNQSSAYSGAYLAGAAFDGNLGGANGWATGVNGPPQWVTVQFPFNVDIKEMTLYAKQDQLGGAPTAFHLDYWDYNTSAWVTVQSWTCGAWTAGLTRTFAV